MKKSFSINRFLASALTLVMCFASAKLSDLQAQPPVYATIINPHQKTISQRTRGLKPNAMPQPGKANNPKAPPTELQFARTRGASREAILAVFWSGVEADLAAKYQYEKLRAYLNYYNENQIANFAGILAQCGSETQRVFLLKSFVAGEPWDNLLAYSAEMRECEDDEVISRSTMRDNPDLIQQWQDSCGPSMVQTVAGEADPRYAWELNKLGDITKIDPFGQSASLASQQKAWLESNGGVAVPRGERGQGIPITEFLNKSLGPIVGAAYVCQVSTNQDYTLNKITEILQNGYDVPICIGWDESGSNNHFVVILSVRGATGNRTFQIHDTWTGMTEWVSESSIRQNRLSPIFDNYARLSHYYEPMPQ